MNLEKEHFSQCDHEGLLEEVTFEQRPRCEELKEKHLSRGDTDTRAWRWDRAQCLWELGRGCSDRSQWLRGAGGPGGMQLEKEEEVRPCRCLQSASNHSEFGFYSKNSGKPWKEFKQKSEMIRFTVIKKSLNCGKIGLKEGQNGRRDARLEGLPRDSIKCDGDLFLFLVPPSEFSQPSLRTSLARGFLELVGFYLQDCEFLLCFFLASADFPSSYRPANGHSPPGVILESLLCSA